MQRQRLHGKTARQTDFVARNVAVARVFARYFFGQGLGAESRRLHGL